MARPKKLRASGGVTAVVGIVALMLAYLLPFAAVVVDELVLNTNFFSQHMPSWFEEAFQVLYWPLIELIRLLGIIA